MATLQRKLATSAGSVARMMRPGGNGIVRWQHHVAAAPIRANLRARSPILGASTTSYRFQHERVGLSGIQYREKNKSAKIAKHIHNLEELGHSKEREAAQERRQKKKDKKAAKPGKGDALPDHLMDDEEELVVRSAASVDHDDHDEEEDEEEDEEGLLPDPQKVKVKLDELLEKFQVILRKTRGAEPTAEMFDGVMVDAYGEMTPLNSVAQIVIASNTLAHATCYDPALTKHVSDAIRDKLELNPQIEEEGVVKIPLPRISMETRQNLAKNLGKKTENYRQKLRNVRRHFLDVVKQGVHGKLEHVSKDDAFRVQQEIEKFSDDAMAKLNNLAKDKEAAILAV